MKNPHTRQSKGNNNQESGYTLIELLFAMQISMLVITLVYANVLFFQKYYTGVENRFKERMKDMIFSQVMIKKISETREIVQAGPRELIIVMNKNDTCCWNLHPGINNDRMSNESFSTSFLEGDFQYLIQTNARQYWTVHPEAEEIREITAVRLNIYYGGNDKKKTPAVTIRLLKRKIPIIL